ncbi:hypothetical protein PRIPAC_75551, partial [Pristionchus pacificus]|uniref:Uncharacterized protein n=1 Tax=Pristionchus pacificus TaxID=54126 RepID=A0A8R1UD47_PRIPA
MQLMETPIFFTRDTSASVSSVCSLSPEPSLLYEVFDEIHHPPQVPLHRTAPGGPPPPLPPKPAKEETPKYANVEATAVKATPPPRPPKPTAPIQETCEKSVLKITNVEDAVLPHVITAQAPLPPPKPAAPINEFSSPVVASLDAIALPIVGTASQPPAVPPVIVIQCEHNNETRRVYTKKCNSIIAGSRLRVSITSLDLLKSSDNRIQRDESTIILSTFIVGIHRSIMSVPYEKDDLLEVAHDGDNSTQTDSQVETDPSLSQLRSVPSQAGPSPPPVRILRPGRFVQRLLDMISSVPTDRLIQVMNESRLNFTPAEEANCRYLAHLMLTTPDGQEPTREQLRQFLDVATPVLQEQYEASFSDPNSNFPREQWLALRACYDSFIRATSTVSSTEGQSGANPHTCNGCMYPHNNMMKFLLFLVSFLPSLNTDPVPDGPHGDGYFRHTVDIQGRVGCSGNDAFLPMKRDWGMMDIHGSNNEGEFRVDGASYGLFTHPTSYIGIVLACDAIDFENQFRLCDLRLPSPYISMKVFCPTGKAWRVRKQLLYSDNTGHGSHYAFHKCQMDLDLAHGVVADYDHQKESLAVNEHREHENEIRPACIHSILLRQRRGRSLHMHFRTLHESNYNAWAEGAAALPAHFEFLPSNY